MTNKSIPAITSTDNEFSISTDEKFFITDLSSFLLSILERSDSELRNVPIQQVFIKGSLLQGDSSSTTLKATTYPFYAKASIQPLKGNAIDTLWVVTPIADSVIDKIIGFRWTGCKINAERFNLTLLSDERSCIETQTQRIHAEQLNKTEIYEIVTSILNCITDGFAALDKNFVVTLWNPVAVKLTGVEKVNILGKYFWRQFPNLVRSSVYTAFKKALYEDTTVNFEQYVKSHDSWFEASVYPYEGGIFIYFKDITFKKKKEKLLSIEKNTLEINVNPDGTLKSTVDFLLAEIEDIIPGIFCSVLLLDEYNKRMRHLSAPRLPEEYKAAIDGKLIEPDMGAFATAMFARRMVIVSDIATDIPGSPFRNIALKQMLRTCLFVPIVNAQDELMGCFACYYKESKTPSEEDVSLIERTVNLLRIIIEDKKAEEKVRISNDRYIKATHAAKKVIWDWDVKTGFFYWGEGFYNLFGYKTSDRIDTYKFWETRIHPDDRESVRKSMRDFIIQGSHDLWSCEYRFEKSNGSYATVTNRGHLIFDKNDEPLRMIGSIEDVTEKKRIEKKLIKQEIDKQKLIALAVVETQEKERAKIGKELHENVNQVLSTAKLLLDVAKTNSKERANLIKKSSEHIYFAINEITKLTWALVPQSISDLGLIETIKDLLKNIGATKTVTANFHHIGDIENEIHYDQKLMLFRILYEQVNNVLNHSEAKNLHIELLVNQDAIELSITDDGKGFDPEKIKNKNGSGLINISSRVEFFNGKVKIISAPGKGCKLIINIIKIL